MGGNHSNYYECYECGRIYEIYDKDKTDGDAKDEWVVLWGKSDKTKEMEIDGWDKMTIAEDEGGEFKIVTTFFNWSHTKEQYIRVLYSMLEKLKEMK